MVDAFDRIVSEVIAADSLTRRGWMAAAGAAVAVLVTKPWRLLYPPAAVRASTARYVVGSFDRVVHGSIRWGENRSITDLVRGAAICELPRCP